MEYGFKRIEVTLLDNGFQVNVTKTFAPEHGVLSEGLLPAGGYNIHRALDVAREMVTVSPARRSEEEVEVDPLDQHIGQGLFKK